MSTVSGCTANYTTPCAPCYIAASTVIHSFPYDLTTVEVEATPYIYPGRNGSSSTSWKYVTLTQTLHPNASGDGIQATGTNDGITFSDPAGVSWITRDLTLTYPTTYVEYRDFSGVGADISNPTDCAQTASVSRFLFASETVEMSFVMQWKSTNNAYPGPATSLPPEILKYLDTIPAVTSQLGGHPVASCLPANAPPGCIVPSGGQPAKCSTGCVTGLPTSTMLYTNTSTIVQPASVQTFTALSSSSPSYSYISHPETTIYTTATSSTTLVNTKGNYTTVSCWSICEGSLVTSSTAAFSTFSLTTASILTTINKDPIFATVPDGIVDVEGTPTVGVPTRSAVTPSHDTTTAKPVVTPSPDTITARPPTLGKEPTRAYPTAIPVQEPQSPERNPDAGPTSCTDALCALTTVVDSNPEPTRISRTGDGDTPQSTPSSENNDSDNSDDNVIGAVITAGSRIVSISMASGGAFVVEGKTINPGEALTLSNSQVISMDKSAIHVGSSDYAVSTIGGGEPRPAEVVFTDSRGDIKTGTQISAGIFAAGSETVTAGQGITLQSGGVTTIGVEQPTGSPVHGAIFTIGDEILTASAIGSGEFVIGSATLSTGQTITLSNGDVVSAGSDGVQLGTSTLAFSALGIETTTPAGIYTFDQQILTPGGVITQGSATISLDDSGRMYYINGSPTPVSDGVLSVDGTDHTAHTTMTGSRAVGDYIMDAIASVAERSTTTTTTRKSGSESGSSHTATASGSGAQGLRSSRVCVAGLMIIAVFAAML